MTGGSSFPAGNADPVAQPLSAEEERLLRALLAQGTAFTVVARAWLNGCIATLDAARGSSPLTTQGPRSAPSDRPASGLTDPDNAALRRVYNAAFAAAPASVIASHDATTPAGLDDHHHPDTLCPICRYWYAALASPEEPSGSSLSVKADPR